MMPQQARTAIIIGAGPAGLTAAYELLTRTNVRPIVLEQGDFIGGISRTVQHKGNRIDIGGHRFFSKSDRVMQWWLDRLPLMATHNGAVLAYQGRTRDLKPAQGPDPQQVDRVMLVRSRKSRIYYRRRFFDYPLAMNLRTLRNMGLLRSFWIGLSYLWASAFPIKPEQTLEQFLINRFGRELYLTFFKSYTEKVWGVPCDQISAQWGAQRIKGLSILKALRHAAAKPFRSRDLAQKSSETSLIEQFMYPKFGPGQMWEHVRDEVVQKGGQVHLQRQVVGLELQGQKVTAVQCRNLATGEVETYKGDLFYSTMPIKDLVRAMQGDKPRDMVQISEGLVYRDFITVGLLLTGMKASACDKPGSLRVEDNWIYVQEPDVLVGRLQVFNNWSPYLVADGSKTWVGMEYFCNEGDSLWSMPDSDLTRLAGDELAKIGLIDRQAVLDAVVIRVPKTYPAYFGTYDRFDDLRAWLDRFENLTLLGRNGMHRYNNQDHSMLTAMVAVDNLVAGRDDRANIWAVNTEQEYHEAKDSAAK